MADVIAELHGESFEIGWSVASVRSLLTTPGTFAVIAVAENDRPEGFIMARIAAGEGEILSLATRPTSRRSGVARQLLEEALQILARQNCKDCFLEVAEDNAAALHLYRGCGFGNIGRRTAYYRSGYQSDSKDALILRCGLANSASN